MLTGLIGRKLGMTGIFNPEGGHVPVTVLEVGPCVVTQVKTVATDGYDAIQVGFSPKKARKVNKPMAGHLKKSGAEGFYKLREFRVENPEEFEVGQTVSTELFAVGEHVDIAGTTKGRGFSGVIKRHGFHGGKETHGCTTKRAPGSIGCSAWPSRVIKGKRLPGQYGNTRQTTKNLVIVDIRPEENLILVRGAVPGSPAGFVEVLKRKVTGKEAK